MKGLLYKEFLVIRGRILLMGIGIALLAFLMLRIAFPGADVIAKEEELSSIPVGYMYDTWLMFFAMITPVLGIGLLTPLVKMLTESGRRRKEPRNRHRDGALAAPGLADDAKDLAAPERQCDVAGGASDLALVVAERNVQVFYLKQHDTSPF